MSEDAKKELASDGIREEPRDDSHHCPASIIHFAILHWREETLTVVVLHYHLGFLGEQVVLSVLICGDGHVFCNEILQKYIAIVKVCQAMVCANRYIKCNLNKYGSKI